MDYSLLIDVRSQGISKVEADLQGLTVGMERTSQASDRLESSFRRVGNNERRLTSSNVNRFSSAVGDANNEVNSLNRSLNTLSSLVVGGVFLGFARSCISAAQDTAQLKAQIRALGEDAETTYGNLRDFSLTLAGLNTEGVVKAYSAFRRMGYASEEAKNNIEALDKGLASFGSSAGISNVMVQLEQLSNKTSGFTQDLRAISNYLYDVIPVVLNQFGASTIEQLQQMGVTGRQITDAITSHYGQLDAPANDINMAMNRLNSSIQEIKSNVGLAFEPLITQLSKILQFGAKISQNDFFGSAIASATKFFAITGGVALLVKSVQALNTHLQQTRTLFSSIFSRASGCDLLISRLRQADRSVNVNSGDLSRQFASQTVVATNTARRTGQVGNLIEELTIQRQINNYVNEMAQAENRASEVLRTRLNLTNLQIAELERELVLTEQLGTVESEIAQLEARQNLSGSEQIATTNRLTVLRRQQLAIEREISGFSAERLRLDELDAQAVAQIRNNMQMAAAANRLRVAGQAQRQNVMTAGRNFANQAVPYVSMAIMMAGDYFANKARESADKLKAAFSSLNVSDMAKAQRESKRGAGTDYWQSRVGQGAEQGAGLGAMVGMGGGILWTIIGALAGAVIGGIMGGETSRRDANSMNALGAASQRIDERYSSLDRRVRTLREQGNNEEAERIQAHIDYEKSRALYDAYASQENKDPEVLKQLYDNIVEAKSRMIQLDNQSLRNARELTQETEKQLRAIQNKSNKLSSDIASLQYQISGDDYTSGLIDINSEYEEALASARELRIESQNILANEQATAEERAKATANLDIATKEEEKAYLIAVKKTQELQKQNAELQNQKLLNKIKEQGELNSSNALISGDKYASDMAKNEADLMGVLNDMNASNEKKANALNQFRINSNRADLDRQSRLNNYQSKLLQFNGDSLGAKLNDINSKYNRTMNDITVDNVDKLTAGIERNIDTLNVYIDKIKTVFSNYFSNLSESINKQKDAISGAIQNAKEYRDTILGAFSQGQQYLRSSAYFDTSRPEYSDEELKYGWDKYWDDKNYNDKLNERVDKLVNGGQVTRYDELQKSFNDISKKIEQNDLTAQEILKELQTLSPSIKGSSKLFQDAWNSQMAF